MLVRFGVARVAADPPRGMPACEPGGAGEIIYFRLHGSPRPYFSPYPPERIIELATRLAESTVPTWCIFDNTRSGTAAATALELVRSARSRGIDIGADIYPYIAASHGLAIEVPRWAQDGGRQKFIARLRDPALRPRLKQETDAYIQMKYYNEETKAAGYDAVLIASTQKPNDASIGKTIGQIAKERASAVPTLRSISWPRTTATSGS